MENHRLKAVFLCVLVLASGAAYGYEYNLENAVVTSIASVSAPDLTAIDTILGSQKELLTRYFRKEIQEKPVVHVGVSVADFQVKFVADWHFGGVYQNGKIGVQPISVLRQKRSLETVLRHEYTHFYFDRLFPEVPYFLQEGLASYFGGLALDRVSPILPGKMFRWEKEFLAGGLPDMAKVRALYSSARYFVSDVAENSGRNALLALITNSAEDIRRAYGNHYENNSFWVRVLVNPRGETRSRIDFDGICRVTLTDLSGRAASAVYTNSLFVEWQENRIFLGDTPVRDAYLSFDDGFRMEDRSFRKDLRALSRGTNFYLVNVLPVEYYLYGVTGSEMPSEKPEALKAQAVLSRSLAYYRMRRQPEGSLWDVSPLTDDQSYRGWKWETAATRRAVEDTENEILTWKDRLILPFFSSTCGGWTAEARNVWGSDASYTKQVNCAAGKTNLCGNSPHFGEWKRVMTSAEISNVFGYAVTDIQTVVTDPRGRVREVVVNGQVVPGQAISFDRFKSIMAAGSTNGWAFLKSNLFTVTNTADGGWEFTGRGLGHGAGLCQYGAIRLADAANYTNIVNFYFQDVRIENYHSEMGVFEKE